MRKEGYYKVKVLTSSYWRSRGYGATRWIIALFVYETNDSFYWLVCGDSEECTDDDFLDIDETMIILP